MTPALLNLVLPGRVMLGVSQLRNRSSHVPTWSGQPLTINNSDSNSEAFAALRRFRGK